MENFIWTEFTKRIAVKSSMKTIYDAWTKSGDLETWFLSKAHYKSAEGKVISANENAEAGYVYDWKWFAQDFHENGKLNQANGKNFIEFTFIKSIVQVQLTQEEGHVFIELKQFEIPTDEDSKKDIRLGCSEGWSLYLLNLKSILEGGIDLRNKDTKLAGVVNN